MTSRNLWPDRLLEGEDSQTLFPGDSRHWIAVYEEMIGFKEDLLARIREALETLPPQARKDVVDNDVSLLTEQLDRYRRRLQFWYARQLQLEGMHIDYDKRSISYQDRAMRLTKRELQLFVLLVSHSPRYVSPGRLLEEAWHDARLPEETLRTYITRLRAKLATLRMGAQIINQPRRGYAVVFAERTQAQVASNVRSVASRRS